MCPNNSQIHTATTLIRRAVLLLTAVGATLLPCTGTVLAQPTTFSSPSQAAEDAAPGEVLVKFKERSSKAKKEEVHGKKGGRAKEIIPAIDVEVVAVERGKEKEKAKEYKDDPNVEFAEVNGVYEALQTISSPNDPKASEQWQYKNPRYITPKKGDIDAYEAWSGVGITWDGGTTGSSSVAIAVLDTGIKENHEDLTGKVTKRVNYTDSSTNSDVKGHGTHVAGSAAALTNNQKGVAGTCPGCALYNVKVLGDTGSGYYSWMANGIRWATDNGAKVINMSLGGTSPSSTLQSAIDYAWSKGVVVVAAAGNSNTSSQFYPAAYSKVIAVGATDNTDAKASFSNYGSSWVDVAAPGVGILSTTNNEGYQAWTGTSMATPHVAGVAGLVWSKSGLCGASDNACVRNQIESKADAVSGTGTYWAKGRINANGSVEGVTSVLPPTPSDTTAPTVSSVSPSNGKTQVSRGTNVTATFSEQMDSDTLTSSTVQLKQKVRKKIRRHGKVRRVWRWVPVSATVSYNSLTKTVTLDPYGTSETSLAPYRNHGVVITTGAKDEAGNALAQNYSWTFTTGSE
jgi:thermitase